MINQGFNPLEEMARKTGKTIGQLKDEMSKGAISAQMVQDAFMSATQEGGKFFGMSESGSQTINGQLSMLGDAWDNLYNSIGQKAEDVLGGVISFATTLVNNWQKLIPILIGVGAAYGVVKLAEIGAIEAEKELTAAKMKLMGVTISSTAAEGAGTSASMLATAWTGLKTKAQLAYNAALSACPYVAVALGISALGYWIYDTFIKTTKLEEAMDGVNTAFANAEFETKKDTSSLTRLCEQYEKSSSALEELRKAKEGDNVQTAESSSLTASLASETDKATAVTENNTTATDDNTEAVGKEKKALEDMNSAKGEIIALAAKYGIELTSEQLKVENLADTYKELAKQIENSNKAKVLNQMKDTAESSIEGARSEMVSGMTERWQKVMGDKMRNAGQDEYNRLADIESEGRVALQSVLDKVKDGTLKFSERQLNNWDSFMVSLKMQSGADSEEYKKLREYFGELRSNSWRERKADTSFDYLADAVETIQAQGKAITYAQNRAGEEAQKLAEQQRNADQASQKESAKHSLTEITKRIIEAQAEIKKLRAKMQAGEFTDEDIKALEEQQKAEDTAKKEYKQATGKDYGAQTKDSAKKTKEEELKIEEELFKLRRMEENLKKSALQFQMGETKSLKEKKRLEEEILEIERKQAIEDLERQRDKQLKAIDKRTDLNKSDKEKLKKKTTELYNGTKNEDGTTTGGLIEMKGREFDQKAQQQNIKYLKEVENRQKELVQSYGTYTDKKKQMDKDWAEEYAKLIEAGFTDDSAEMQKALKEYKRKGDDLLKSYTFDETEYKEQRGVENDLNKIVGTYAGQGFDVLREQIGAFSKILNAEIADIDKKIETAKAEGDDKAVASLEAQREQNLKALNVAREKALEIDKEANEQQIIAQNIFDTQIAEQQVKVDYLQGQIEDVSEQIAQAEESGAGNDVINKLERERAQLVAKQTQASEKLQKLEDKKAKTANKTQKQIEKQNEKLEKTKQWAELTRSAFSELGDTIGGLAGDIASLIADISSDVINAIGSIQQYNQAVLEAEKKAAEGTAESISTVEKASVILAVISAVIQVATKIASMFSKRDKKNSDIEDTIARYREMSSIYGEMADKQAEIAANARTSDVAKKATDEQIKLMQKQADAEREIIKQRAGYREKREHSVGYKLNDQLQNSEWQSAFRAQGVAVKDWNDLMNLSADDLKSLRENNAYLWSSLDGDIKQSLESLISLGEAGEEVAQTLKDQFAGITLEDLKDSAVDAFANMEADATDFADTISSTLKNAILNATVEKEFSKELSDLQDQMSRAGEDGFDPQEASRLMQKANELQERINARKAELATEYGESGVLAEADARDDNTQTTGTFAEMSEATANALEGRFTAVYESNLRIEGAITAQTNTLAGLSSESVELISQQARIAEAGQTETQRILAESLIELKTIAENGGAVLKIVRTMAADLAEVKTSTGKL